MAADPFPTSGSPGRVFFERAEFLRILNLYGRMVAAGEWKDYAIDPLPDACVFSVFRRAEWKDYAIDPLPDACVFSVFRRASEAPAYRIEKRPALARRQGAWAVIGEGGMILKRGHDLAQVLTVFDSRRFRVVD